MPELLYTSSAQMLATNNDNFPTGHTLCCQNEGKRNSCRTNGMDTTNLALNLDTYLSTQNCHKTFIE